MKISYLHLRNYKQFSDLELDLTYPAGHAKAGQPLDKICIIGQSGTGKTNLLEVIARSTVDFSMQPQDSYLPFSAFTGAKTDDKYITTRFSFLPNIVAEALFTEEESQITFLQNGKTTEEDVHPKEHERNYFVSTVRCGYPIDNRNGLVKEFDNSKMSSLDKKTYEELNNAMAKLVLESINEPIKSTNEQLLENLTRSYMTEYYPTRPGRKKTVREKRQELQREIDRLEEKYTTISQSIDKLKHNNFVDRFIVDINNEGYFWDLLRERIESFDAEKNKISKKLTDKLLHDDGYTKERFKKEMIAWEKENENILTKMAVDINTIIQKFNLELQINETTQSYDELLIKDLSNGTTIKYDDLSTGTKNLLSTFIPLKSYKPKDSIILIDEPEMSFYPDIQRQLVDLYTTVGENNQLIVATHSPLIASSFEPWEVVELKFDASNQIYRERYYEGDNHVNNYSVDPRMLTWTGILTDVFDLQEDSNFSFREKRLMEYATLKAEIRSMENKTSKEADKKIKQFKKLSALLGLQN